MMYLVVEGNTSPAPRLIAISTKPTTSRRERGFMNSQTCGSMVRTGGVLPRSSFSCFLTPEPELMTYTVFHVCCRVCCNAGKLGFNSLLLLRTRTPLGCLRAHIRSKDLAETATTRQNSGGTKVESRKPAGAGTRTEDR